uniref:Ubiquinone biosynthesis monooxygenase COQ6, mitochondrial-like n=1 Tax=Phallusia mammillata TaxID=59560 RepID=A0A6F9D995_9ASCI|nr:ubiquinone biosynthesis monooxygenase COQ6, mitochondrial-like [Phallusia mammillata]
MITGSFSKLLESKFNDQVEVQYNCKVVSCENPQNFAFKDGRQSVPLVTLKLSDDTEVKTRLLIAADGANSFIAQSCGVNYFKRPYDQSAVVSNLRLHERGENIVAWQRFLPTGPIALLPLDETTSSLVWSTTHQHAKKLLEMQEDEFVSEINNAFWQDYSQQDIVKSLESFTSMLLSFAKSGNDVVMQYPPSVASIAGDRFKFPLGCSHANEYVKPRVAFIGDSIHRVHPLAGQGVNLGFRDVDCLSRVLDKAAYEGKDLGAINHLMEFESEQQKSNIPFVTAVHSLKHMFSTDSTPLVAIRSIGLTLCNSNSVLKKRFIEQATT